MYDQPK